MASGGSAALFSAVVIPTLWRDADYYRVSGAASVDARSLTYGEVLPESIEADVWDACLRECAVDAAAGTVLPSDAASPSNDGAQSPPRLVRKQATPARSDAAAFLGSRAGAPLVTLYDLGSGTGKIVLQLALLARAYGVRVRCVGIEIVSSRHDGAIAAFDAAARVTAADLAPALAAFYAARPEGSVPVVSAASLAAELRDASTCVKAVCGSFLDYDLSDADAIFVNNTVFDPALMAALLERLSACARLRRVVVLRSLCARHRDESCDRKNSACTAFAHPPVVCTKCEPTWDAETTLFAYDKVRSWAPQSTPPASTLETPKRPRATWGIGSMRQRSPGGGAHLPHAQESPRTVIPSDSLVSSSPTSTRLPLARGQETPSRSAARARAAAANAAGKFTAGDASMLSDQDDAGGGVTTAKPPKLPRSAAASLNALLFGDEKATPTVGEFVVVEAGAGAGAGAGVGAGVWKPHFMTPTRKFAETPTALASPEPVRWATPQAEREGRRF